MRHRPLTAAVLIAAHAAVASAQTAPETPPPREGGGFLSLTFENDIFGGTDRDYTNGVRASWTSRRNDLPLWGRWARRALAPLTPADDWYVGYALGHTIHTPEDLTLEDPPPDARPYAGFLYGSLAVIADAGDRLDTLALDIGIVGPASGAEWIQKRVHENIAGTYPEGWDTQLHNEVAFRLLYERKWRRGTELFGGIEADAIPDVAVSLGTLDTSLTAGLTLRVGQGLDADYGPPRIRPAVSGPAFFGDGDRLRWSLFAGVAGRVVGRDLFIEGNTFRDSRSVEPERLVGDVHVGAGIGWGPAQLTYTQVIRSPEHESQKGWLNYGSLTLGVRF